jgi:hypothetical protein
MVTSSCSLPANDPQIRWLHRLCSWVLPILFLGVGSLAYAQASPGLYRVTMRDGQTLDVILIEEHPHTVEFALRTGQRLIVMRSAIQSMKHIPAERVRSDGLWFEDPNRTRYLYGPSAHRLDEGEGYVSSKYGVFLAGGYGITDHVSVTVGTVWLLLLLGEPNLIAGLKVGGSVNDWFHIGMGSQVFLLPLANVLGFVFASATLGDTDKHLTLSVGRPVGSSHFASQFGPVMATGDYQDSCRLNAFLFFVFK